MLAARAAFLILAEHFTGGLRLPWRAAPADAGAAAALPAPMSPRSDSACVVFLSESTAGRLRPYLLKTTHKSASDIEIPPIVDLCTDIYV